MAMPPYNVLDEKRVQLGELDDANILKLGQGWIQIDRNGLESLVSALGDGWQERRFWLQQDVIEYEGCRIVTESRTGATIGYVAERRSP
jgi:hypothetical protein